MRNFLNPNAISEEEFFKYIPIVITTTVFAIYLGYAFYCIITQFYKNYLESKNENYVYGLSTTSTRSGKWKNIAYNYKKKNGKCAVCGKTEKLVVHHKIPFHMNPEKELDENNFVVLCENRPVNCHYLFGHLMDWQGYNPNINEDVEIWKKRLEKNLKN